MIINLYGRTVKLITSRNPQANAKLERVLQTIDNIPRTFKVQNMKVDDENPWDGILASIIFALRATVHTTTQYTPAQLIFRRDTIINQHHDVDWETIRTRKQELINKGNERENHKQINHSYKQGDKVLLKNAWKTKSNQDAYLDPYVIAAVRNNGTVRARKGRITDTFNIQNLTTYKE